MILFFNIELINAKTFRFQSHTKQILDEIKSTKEEAEELADKLKQKATLHAKLVDEFEKNNRNLNRLIFDFVFSHLIQNIAIFSKKKKQKKINKFICLFFAYRNSYTSRILEIIGNIRKQKASIDKVLNDTRDIQKEINTINGQLDRQFTVTDDLLFKVTKSFIELS